MGNNNNLNKRIIENVRNRVVISNIESEVNMKLSKRKQILSVVTVCMIMLGGSFITVNAATDGQLVEKVTETIQVVFRDKNGNETEIDGAAYVNHNNENVEQYQYEKDGIEYNIEVNKDTLNDLDSKAWVELDEGDEVLEFEMQYDYVDEK